MPVDSQHHQYSYSLSKWKLVRDCIKGSKAIKEAGEVYLPNPNPNNSDSISRYTSYVQRAIFTNVIKVTNDSMVGFAFKDKPTTDIPSQLDYLIKNATGDGVTLEQLAKNIVANLLQTGRYGLLTDYPSVDQGLSDAQVQGLNVQANIKPYLAESIINWKTEAVGGIDMLVQVVLKEDYPTAIDEFDYDTATQYRVLSLVDGVYTITVYREDEIISVVEPRDSSGSRLKFIPFVIAGSYSNDPATDDAPLYDISEINIGHYRNSADKEEGLFLHGQPMLHLDIGDTNSNEWKELNPNGVEVGARRGLITSGGGSATLLQTTANDAVSSEMQQKLKEMVAIGARLIDQGSGQAETATAAMIRHAGSNSVLSNVVQNTSSALELSLSWAGLFMGANTLPTYVINDDFYDSSLDAAQVMASIQLYDRGIIAKEDLQENARNTGLIDPTRTSEDIESDVDDISPIE
tara:strand:- start:1098 stop:2483 length:1386 start_codon:yes stop_codon:yes gene_type:complete